MKQNHQEVFDNLKENSQSRLIKIINEEKWNHSKFEQTLRNDLGNIYFVSIQFEGCCKWALIRGKKLDYNQFMEGDYNFFKHISALL